MMVRRVSFMGQIPFPFPERPRQPIVVGENGTGVSMRLT